MWPGQGHIAGKAQSWNLNPGLFLRKCSLTPPTTKPLGLSREGTFNQSHPWHHKLSRKEPKNPLQPLNLWVRKRHQNPEFKGSGFTALSFWREKTKSWENQLLSAISRENQEKSLSGKARAQCTFSLSNKQWGFQCSSSGAAAFSANPDKCLVICELPALRQRWLLKSAQHCHNGWRKTFCTWLCDLRNSVYLYVLVYRGFLLGKGCFFLF